MRKLVAALCCIGLSATLLTGCNKDEIEKTVLTPYDISVPYADTFSSAENVAVQFQNYVRLGYWNLAYSLVDMPDDVLLSAEGFNTAENELSTLDDTMQLYAVSASSSTVTLVYYNKVGEAFSKGKDSTYVGDIVEDLPIAIKMPISNSGDGYKIGVKDAWVSQDIITLKVPEACSVRIGGKLLDDTARDDDGYYTITHFINGDTLSVDLNSAVEEKTIVLNRKSASDSENEDTSDNAEPSNVVNMSGNHNGYPAYVYEWRTSRTTNDEALEYAKEATQMVFTSICTQEDFYAGSYLSVMAANANLEAMKPTYIKAQSTYANTSRRIYRDLTVIDLVPWDEKTQNRKGVYWGVRDRNTMSIYVDVSFSYVAELREDGSETVRTGSSSGEITLTKENGEWKLLGISDKILKALV